MRTALQRIGMVMLIGALGILLINPFDVVDRFNKLLPEWATQNSPWTFAIVAGLIMIASAILDPKIFDLGGREQERNDEHN